MVNQMTAQNHGRVLLEMKGIGKTFPGVKALEGVNLTVREGQVHALLGENGAGKSTLIKILSGAYTRDEGEILFDGKSLKDTKIGYVFQNYREALFPWMRTIDNIAYPLLLEGRGKAEVDRRMAELVASFDVKFDLLW